MTHPNISKPHRLRAMGGAMVEMGGAPAMGGGLVETGGMVEDRTWALTQDVLEETEDHGDVMAETVTETEMIRNIRLKALQKLVEEEDEETTNWLSQID